MARLNIEGQFWLDVMKLIAKMGDQDRAIGQALRFLRFAQEKHKNGEPMTLEEFTDQGFSDDLIGVFAKHSQAEPKHVQAKGFEKHFGWLDAKKAAGKRGGEASAKRQRDENGHFLPKQTPSKTKHSQPSSSFSSLSSLSKSPNAPHLGEVSIDTAKDVIPFEVRNPIGYFIGAYRKAFKERYPDGGDPDVRGKIQGQIKTLLKDYPIDRAVQMIQVYCQMDGHRDWFKTKGHDFGTFIENLNPIIIAMNKGSEAGKPSDLNWNEIFGREGTENV